MATTRSHGARRRRLPQGRPNRVVVRLSDEEYLAVAARAAGARLTIPSYLATCGLTPEGVPATEIRYALTGLNGSRRVLAGVANNLNQLTARLHASGDIGVSLPAVLDAVERAVARIQSAADEVENIVGGRVCPMISKALRGANMRGVLRYLFGPGSAEEHTTQRVIACSDPTWVGASTPGPSELHQLVAELDDTRVRFGDPTARGYVLHVPISVPAVDGKLTDDQWRTTATLFAEKLDFGPEVRWAAVHHGPSRAGNDHIHLVANLIREDGSVAPLSWERLRRREACIELEDRFDLTRTAAVGRGQKALARHEVERLRRGEAVHLYDLDRSQVAARVRAVAAGVRRKQEFVSRLRGDGLVVQPRYAANDASVVVGYSVGSRRSDGSAAVMCGGGTLTKDLRLPALRVRWSQPAADAAAWRGAGSSRSWASTRHIAAASELLNRAAEIVGTLPYDDIDAWCRVVSDPSGVLFAAGAGSASPMAQRTLYRAGDALIAVIDDLRGKPSIQRLHGALSAADWPAPVRLPSLSDGVGGDTTWLIDGASHVLIAPKSPGDRNAVEKLVIQAVATAAAIAQALAARADASTAAVRAAEATARAAAAPELAAPVDGWRLAKTGGQVLAEARRSQATSPTCDDIPQRTPAVHRANGLG